MCSPIAASSALVAVFAVFLPLTPAAMAQPGAGDFDNSGAVDARERANLTPDPPAWFRRGAKQK